MRGERGGRAVRSADGRARKSTGQGQGQPPSQRTGRGTPRAAPWSSASRFGSDEP